MRIEKHVTLEADVDVDVSLEDITACIAAEFQQEGNERHTLFEAECALSRGLTFIVALPDDVLAKLRPGVRKVVADRLREQADRYARFKPADPPCSP